MDKLRVVFDNRHQDYSGGGEHVRMLISLFLQFAEVYVTKNPEFYLIQTYGNTTSQILPRQYKFNFKPDLYVLVDYSGWAKPIGYVNAQICFYAVKKKTTGYRYAFCLNEFVASSIRENWDSTPVIIEPYFDPTKFSIGLKKNKIINIGNFFIERDGHSKNQHLLLEWFLGSGLIDEGWEFDLFGFVNNKQFFDGLVERYRNIPSIRFFPNASFLDLKNSLAESRFMVHAMGYGRELCEQTEHFGLVAPQALLAGCRPIVHRSGGCQFIPGVISYKEFSELGQIIRLQRDEPSDLKEFGLVFDFNNSISQLKSFVENSPLATPHASGPENFISAVGIKIQSFFRII